MERQRRGSEGQQPKDHVRTVVFTPSTVAKDHIREYPQDVPRGRAEDTSKDGSDDNISMAKGRGGSDPCPGCGRIFKNYRGLRIHQGKTKCLANLQHCSNIPVGRKTEDIQEQEAHHSFQEVHAEEEPSQQEKGQKQDRCCTPSNMPRKARLKLPAANSKEWQNLDEDLEQILENALKGTATEKMEQMPKTVYDICMDRFGIEDSRKATPKSAGPSRRQREIGNIRRDLRKLTCRWKEASHSEKEGLQDLRAELRSRLLTLRRAENQKKKSKEKRKARSSFLWTHSNTLETYWGGPSQDD